ncbi:MAG: zinc ABC transporter substrate-binding protein [Candidatus Nezhaarchaeota archaeon]|nr:zinc ABC transporter substrate-binding protein [Candidatus Nezhaarchaeota archaeon]
MTSTKQTLKARFIVFVITLLAIISLNPIPIIAAENNSKPVVVATTTVLASVVEDLAGDKVVIEYIVLPSVCPAHHDIKPSDIEKLRLASLILAHGVEPWLDKLLEASGSQAPVAWIKGSWNTPSAAKSLYTNVAQALKTHLGLDVEAALNRCLKIIDDVDRRLRRLSEDYNFKEAPVVVMVWQRPFIEYLGFKVVASYNPPEKVSLKEYEEVLRNASEHRALLVIDNVPSGVELGLGIASKVGAVHVALHNFPRAVREANNLTAMMLYNAELLGMALNEARNARTLETLITENLSLRSSLDSLTVYLGSSIIVNAILALALAVSLIKLRRFTK